ncbi:MAG: hypothetical protein M1353_12605 [Nitrospirae bacterium]|nr:hypothetical protein [Nitrospirota bacterium]
MVTTRKLHVYALCQSAAPSVVKLSHKERTLRFRKAVRLTKKHFQGEFQTLLIELAYILAFHPEAFLKKGDK